MSKLAGSDDPAFPSWNQVGPHGSPFPSGPGISVRDLFVLVAMHALLLHEEAAESDPDDIAEAANTLADAMLKRRNA